MKTVSRHTFRICTWAFACGLAWALAAPLAHAQVTYTVTFEGNWTTDSVPGGVVGGAHFTTLVGAVHNDQITFWEPGGTATNGVRGVAETGNTDGFENEVSAAGVNAVLVKKNTSGGGTPTSTFDVEFTASHPLFTLLSMLGPSPDWFVGVSGLSMQDEQGQWLSDLSVDLFAYDAGTRSSHTFSLGGPSNDPREPIRSLKGVAPFSDVRIARISFEQKEGNAAPAFTGSTSFSVQENATTVGTVQATDSDGADSVTGYAIATGADGTLFSITSAGALSFRTAPNYEDPQDADTDNVYEVMVQATSGTGDRALSATGTMTVTVTDEDGEAPSAPAAPTVTAVSASRLQLTWTAPANAGPDINDYDYRYREEGASAWTNVTNTTITGLSATIDGLFHSTVHEAQVRANNAEGAGAWSSSGTGSTLGLPEASFAASTQRTGEAAGTRNVMVNFDPALSSDITLRYMLDGTALLGEDYAIAGAAGNEGTLAVMSGASSAMISVEITEDMMTEEDETIVLTLMNTMGYEAGSPDFHTLTIADNDPAGVTASALSLAVDEDGADGTYTLRLDTNPGGTVTVTPSSSDAGAVTVSGPLTFDSANWQAAQTITVTPVSDADADNEAVTISHSVTGYGALSMGPDVMVAVDDDEVAAAAGVNASTLMLSLTEGGADGTYTVALRTDPGGTVTVTPSSSDAGAARVSGALTFDGANWQTAQTVTVTPVSDADTDNEAVMITHAVSGYANVSSGPTVIVTVEDNDEPTALTSFAASSQRVGEAAGTRNVMVNFDPAPSSDVTIRYALSGTASLGADYAIAGASGNEGTLAVTSGASSAMISVAITDDADAEDDETVILTIQPGSGYAAGTTGVHTLTITDDDDKATAIESGTGELPESFVLEQNYPNPFNPETTIRYGLPEAGEVRLAVYNVAGHEVATLVDRVQPAGLHAVRFEAGHLPSGVYLYRLQAGGEIRVRTMLLVK